MNIIYNKYTGIIDKPLPDFMDYEVYYEHFSGEFVDSLASIWVDNPPKDWHNYKVVDENLVRKEDWEIEEIELYGKILSNEERLLMKLKPPYDEVKKAQNTIEILTLIQEVM